MAYKVSYFTFKGLGEPVRFMLAYNNVEFEDNRVEWEDWPALKPSEKTFEEFLIFHKFSFPLFSPSPPSNANSRGRWQNFPPKRSNLSIFGK
jgi:hypothetical protein